ncbi:M20 aminoacylase family protein [Chelatococcus reniformis]|uniref:Hippurate hydrolase n=1 Tax=Chelatococcus reniformis TaxID=1494448 RepID=A0A916XEE9_9HYPH|nr:M20 aminoacylase family protein [Chelatococcus reniformis]GGC65753.1 hippurate hydrolase [Chelatococcus reniformis]
MSVLDRIKSFEDELVSIRHTIHAHPEIGFEEVQTSALVAEKLTSWGVEVHRSVGGTGVVGVLRGTGGNARRIGLRADMDALPMQEETGLPFASTIPGKFHGCGHDGHTTMLLGAARYLAETRAFDGTINFIFQPAEEGLGGARAMLADGLFDRFPCDEIYGLHNAPVGPRGKVGICKGPAMAGADFFDIEIIGKGSHGAMPSLGIDPVTIGAELVQAMQTIVSRNVDPHQPAVVSVTQFHAGSAYNVIPERAHLGGTVRAFDDGVFELIRARITALATHVAASHGAEAKVSIRNIFTVLDNRDTQSDVAADVATDLFGADMVNRNETPKMGSEDFADMLRQVPGAYVWLSGNVSAPLHNPAFVFDDGILPLGAALLARIAEQRASAGA